MSIGNHEKIKWYLINENCFFIKAKNFLLFFVTVYSCLLYPIENWEVQLSLIKQNTDFDFEINTMDPEKKYQFNVPLFFVNLDLKYTLLEFQLVICEIIYLLDIIINLFMVPHNDNKTGIS